MNLPELLKIAEAATPGEWKVQLRETEYKEGKTHKEHVIVQSFIHPQLKDHYPIVNLSFGIPKVKGDPAVPLLWLHKENAEFIATFNPAKVSELIKRLQEAEIKAKRYQWILDHGIPESAEFWPAIKIEGLTQEQDEEWCNSFNLDASIEKLIIEMEHTNDK